MSSKKSVNQILSWRFPSEHGILTGINAQVREEEHAMLVQFLGSQQDVSTCRMKKRKQSLSAILAFRSSVEVS